MIARGFNAHIVLLRELGASAGIGLRYQCNNESGALLLLPHPGHKTFLDCKILIQKYMRAHLHEWCAFANDELGIGLEEHDLVFVSGFMKTAACAEAAFHNGSSKAELVVSGGCIVPSLTGEFSVSMSQCASATVRECRC